MFAVIKASGRQWTVKEGETLTINRMASNKVGEKVVFDQVLMVGGSKNAVGTPLIKGAKVEATVTDHGVGEKLVMVKYRRRKNSKKTIGHRQALTSVKINKISL